MPIPEASLHAIPSGPPFDLQSFHPDMFQHQPFQNPTPFNQTQTFAPTMLVHQDSGYEAVEGSPENDLEMNPNPPHHPRIHSSTSQRLSGSMAAPPLPSTEK